MPSGNIVPRTGSPFIYLNPNYKQEPATRYGTTLKRSMNKDNMKYGQLNGEELLHENGITYGNGNDKHMISPPSSPIYDNKVYNDNSEISAFGRTNPDRRPASASPYRHRQIYARSDNISPKNVYDNNQKHSYTMSTEIDTQTIVQMASPNNFGNPEMLQNMSSRTIGQIERKKNRELHSSQSALLNGLKVHSLVNSMVQPVVLINNNSGASSPLDSQHQRNKVRRRRQRPKSAGVRRSKPGVLSKAIRVASTTEFNNRKKRLNRRKSPRSMNNRNRKQRPKSASTMSLRGGTMGPWDTADELVQHFSAGNRSGLAIDTNKSASSRIKKSKSHYLIRPPPVVEKPYIINDSSNNGGEGNQEDQQNNHSPWSVFQSGQDFRKQQYGENKTIGSAVLKVEMPKVFKISST